MKKRISCLLVTALAYLTLVGCVSFDQNPRVEINRHGDVSQQLNREHRVTVLEPLVDYTLQSFSEDPVVLGQEKNLIGKVIATALSDQFAARGLKITRNAESEAAPEKVFLSRRLAGNYTRLMSLRNFYDDPMPSLGPVVNQLSAPLQSDLLVLSRYSGTRKSVGLHRKDIITHSLRSVASLGMQTQVLVPMQFGDLEIALVDGVSGQVVWSAITSGSPDQLAVLIDRLLGTLPL